ncbi:MAG: DNA primase [Rhodospirillales bacterium]|jgi:DNA primase|nr:DNA primase [Rhodospirillales bacterium]MBT4626604.1 DNA primase [Rhodospirillales bacterium]MBT5350336.1 DNA primase [Rhodospirillales bacterium]MBT6110259.1 DNA primase [Rhodospirillales bacterium]MBT6827814.1 DNA primase [Rhodospirillales bacterium]
MAFPAQFLDELRARCSLPEVVGRRVQLRKKGREWEGLCPFHKEKTPSFTVNDEKGFYHCFGCGEHGGVFDFVMKTDGLSFPETVERLATDAGMQVPQDTPEERHRAERRSSLQDVCEAACVWFERNLYMPEGKAALDYLHIRGLSDENIKYFRLGFAPNGRNMLKAAMARDNVPENLLVETGMLIQPPDDRGEGQRDPYDRFRGRVMFPIMDRRGQVIAFGGRILGDGEPKYLNSPETPIFHKGNVLYGLNYALPSAHKSGQMIVTEGYMDVIALNVAGFENAVAPLGTALTEGHLSALWRVVKEPVLCFDGDNAGQRAATRAAERALPELKSGYGIRFAELPQGEDPDTLVRSKGRQVMQGVLDAALPLSEVLWRMESGGSTPRTPEKRAALQQALGAHANRIQDPTVRGHFLKAFKDRIWQGGNTGGGSRGGSGQYKKSRYGAQNKDFQSITGVDHRAKQTDSTTRSLKLLLLGLIAHPSFYDQVGERLGSLDFSNLGRELDNLRQQVLKALAVESGLDYRGLAHHLNGAGYADALEALQNDQDLGDVFFVRTDALPAAALCGWEEAYGLLQGKDLDFEIREAERLLAEDPTTENFQRLQSLKRQEFEASAIPLADV